MDNNTGIGKHREKKLYVDFTESEFKQLEYVANEHEMHKKDVIRSLVKREVLRLIKRERQAT